MKYVKALDINKTDDLTKYNRGQWVKRGKTKGVYVTTKRNGESVIIWHGKPYESFFEKLARLLEE